MSGPKPTLGYPSRTAAVLALKADGLKPAAIAEKIGISVAAVAALECSARRWAGARSRNPDVCRTVLVPLGILQRLAPAARARGLRRETLAELIIETAVEDGLVDAVLDDGNGGRRSSSETEKTRAGPKRPGRRQPPFIRSLPRIPPIRKRRTTETPMPGERILTGEQRLLAERVVELLNERENEADDAIRAMLSVVAATVNHHERRPANAEAITAFYAQWLLEIGRKGRDGLLETAPAWITIDPRMVQ
jgi:hypothetical protein